MHHNVYTGNADMKNAMENGRQTGSSYIVSPSRKLHSGTIGDRLGSSIGSSIEFQDYRDYQPGDDIRRLDWAAYARSDKLTVRLYRDEIQPRMDIVSDCSASMTAPSGVKAIASVFLAGLLAEASFRSSSAVAWWSFGNSFKNIFRLSSRFPECDPPVFGGNAGPEEDISKLQPSLSKRGLRICISDFLWEIPAESILKRLAKNAASLILVNVLCEEETNPPLYGISSLTDAENGSRLDFNIAEPERKYYLSRLEKHFEMWKDASISYDCIFCQVRAEDIIAGKLDALSNAGIIEQV